MLWSRRYRASPSPPPKPPTRVAMGCALGAEVRPASDSVASNRASPAISRASADASVVPPRIRTRRALAMAAERATCPARPWLSIIGIGEDGVAGLSSVAQRLVSDAELVLGGKRHLALADSLIRGRRLSWPSPIGDVLPEIEKHRGRPVAVLASGDPFHYGVGDMLMRVVRPEETLCLPQPSAFGLAASRLGWSQQDVSIVSLHGRALEGIVRYLQPGARILALSWDGETPTKLATLLTARGMGESFITVLEHLGGPKEHVRRAKASAFDLDDVAA